MDFTNTIIVISIFSASLHIYFDYRKNYPLTYIFKPLTLTLIITAAFLKPNYFSLDYKYLVIVGLCFSLVGDILLMFKKSDFFLQGLIAFLFAHLAYLTAIINETGFQFNFLTLIPIGIYFALLLLLILPSSGNKKLYIIIYAAVIGVLLWQAVNLITLNLNNHIMFLVVGIILFTISDSLLAYNKFAKKIKIVQLLILSTYYLAQILIALSI